MASNLGTARQSQLVTTYGVGALIPVGDQSFMLCGLDSWEADRAQDVNEERLARSLRVWGFKAPPATGRRDMPVTRFPLMHYCPGCRRLGMPRDFGASVSEMTCRACDRELTPSRFVACCERGHIEDFPYFRWVHRDQEPQGDTHELFLRTRGESSALTDIEISCSCGVRPVSMQGSFDRQALTGVAWCHGRRPWLLGADDQACDRPLRTLQRGSSNVWFGLTRSAISIPPWSGPTARFVDKHWDVLRLMDGPELGAMVERLASELRLDAAGVLALVNRRKGLQAQVEPTESELRADEYEALCRGNDVAGSDNSQCADVEVATRVADLVAQVSRVSRLREVRALLGFSRVSPVEAGAESVAALSEEGVGWLPAIEVLGEGVFLRLHEDVVQRWERLPTTRDRVALLHAAQTRLDDEYHRPPSIPVSARFVALHSLAHLVLQEMSLDAGYPAGSLRERVYAAEGQGASSSTRRPRTRPEALVDSPPWPTPIGSPRSSSGPSTMRAGARPTRCAPSQGLWR